MPSLLAHARLVAPRSGRGGTVRTCSRRRLPPDVARALSSGTPALEPYADLARAWHAHGGSFLPPYGEYVRELARARSIRTDVALDLACGTGLSTSGLAEVFGHVYALDRSAHMLREARSNLAAFHNVEYVSGDFRSFSLPEPVDLALCTGDSLNYVQSVAELTATLRCVSTALRPGALFIGDLQAERSFRAFRRLVLVNRMSGLEWFQVHDYDPETRLDEAYVVTAAGVESHRRMCIRPDDVRRAAADAGLEVDARFDHPVVRLVASGTSRDFYALRRPGA